MVSFWTGTPGSGKSYHLAQYVFDKLKYNDINIIANFEINLDYVAMTWLGWLKHQITEFTGHSFKTYNSRPLKGRYYYWSNDQITVDNLLDFARENHTRNRKHADAPQTVVLIDESGIVFNCRNFTQSDRGTWTSFFAKHRHYNFDFVLACQFDRQVDKQIRMCVEYELRHRKLKNFQFLGWLLSLLAGGNIFLITETWYATHDKLKIGNHAIRYRNRIASLYDTLAEFTDGLGAPSGISCAGVRGTGARCAGLAPQPDDIDAAASIAALTALVGEECKNESA